MRPTGHVIEFGVFDGTSMHHIAETIAPNVVYGFDSFEGLPERWIQGDEDILGVGAFDLGGEPPAGLPENVELVIGTFQETLKPWLSGNPGPVAFAHIDCDIYSSTICVLKALNERVVPGTMFVFDELMDFSEGRVYPRWPEHEWRALNEWIDEFDRAVVPVSRDAMYRVALKVVK